MKRGAFNPQAALELACLLAFSGTLAYLTFSGAYLSYVAPRMKPYLLFSAAAMLACAVFCAGRLFRRQYRRRSAHCFLLAIPVLLFLLPHGQISTVNSGGLLTGGALTGTAGQTAAVSSPASSPQASSGGASSAPGDALESPDPSDRADVYTVENDGGEAIGVLHGYSAEQKSVAVSDDEFYGWCSEFFVHPDRFAGFEVTLTGYVLKGIPSLASDEFVPARLMMSCCAADLSPCGVVCKYDRVSDLAADSWVTVTGSLEVGTYEGSPEPQIHVSSIAPAQEITDYVYPY